MNDCYIRPVIYVPKQIAARDLKSTFPHGGDEVLLEDMNPTTAT